MAVEGSTIGRVPTIGSVMTPLPRAIDVDTPLREARETMRQRGIRHLPVERGGELVGLLSDRDLKRALDPSMGLPGIDELFAGDVAIYEPFTVEEIAPLDAVLRQMVERHVGSVLVEREGDLLGIFTAMDGCRLLADHLAG